MKAVLLLALCLSLLNLQPASAQTASAPPLCVNDKDGKKGANTQIINQSIYRANDPLTLAFNEYYSKAYLCEPTGDNSPMSFSKAFKLIGDLASSVTSPSATFIKKECVEASLQRDINQTGYTCEGGKPKSFQNTKKGETPCLNQYSVDYIHFSVNLALKCFASVRDPIDARFLLKKLNTETGFNFFLAYDGGTGIGQLTRWPVKEISGTSKGEGNARSIFEDIMASDDPACKPFKKVISQDLDKRPPIPPIKNVCTYVSPNGGLARNLMYGMGYYIFNRDEVVKRYFSTHKQNELLRNREVVSYATLLAYGPDGPNGATAFMDANRFRRGLSPEQALAKLRKSAEYVKLADERYAKELLPGFTPKNKYSREELRGDTCVTK